MEQHLGQGPLNNQVNRTCGFSPMVPVLYAWIFCCLVYNLRGRGETHSEHSDPDVGLLIGVLDFVMFTSPSSKEVELAYSLMKVLRSNDQSFAEQSKGLSESQWLILANAMDAYSWSSDDFGIERVH